MLSNMTIGQYFPTGSVIHKLDARIKLIMTILVIVLVFVANSALTLGICGLFTLTMMLISKINIKMYLKMLKSVWVIIVLTSVLNVLYVTGKKPIFSWWIINVYPEGIARAVLIAVRICMLILVSALLTYTTSPTELTDAIERLLSPLRYIGLGEAVHILAMMTSIALRFIPILIEETDKIMSAQKARGADMESGGLAKRIKSLLPVLIPLLISATRRAYDLAEAMECRCYRGGSGRTKMNRAHLAMGDYVALGVGAALTAIIVVGRILL